MKGLYIICIIFLISCKHSEFDATYAAEKYCNCLKTERAAGKDFFDARTKCDGMMLAENKFFRIDYLGFNYKTRYYTLSLPQELCDSVAKFHLEFFSYIEKSCCKEGLEGCDKNDSLQIKMGLMGKK